MMHPDIDTTSPLSENAQFMNRLRWYRNHSERYGDHGTYKAMNGILDEVLDKLQQGVRAPELEDFAKELVNGRDTNDAKHYAGSVILDLFSHYDPDYLARPTIFTLPRDNEQFVKLLQRHIDYFKPRLGLGRKARKATHRTLEEALTKVEQGATFAQMEKFAVEKSSGYDPSGHNGEVTAASVILETLERAYNITGFYIDPDLREEAAEAIGQNPFAPHAYVKLDSAPVLERPAPALDLGHFDKSEQ